MAKSKKEAPIDFGVKNQHLTKLPVDYLYHLGLSTRDDLSGMLAGVRLVCLGGTAARMKKLAEYMKAFFNYSHDIVDLAENGQRFSMFKTGPVLSVSTGIGASSLSVVLNEVIKLLDYAKVMNVEIIRIGTSGGIGLPPGTVVISTAAINDLFEESHRFHVLGRPYKLTTGFDPDLVQRLIRVAQTTCHGMPLAAGKTMSAPDFYESQARLNGAFAAYGEDDKFEFLMKAQKHGIVNIDMESTLLSAMCRRGGIRCAAICITLLDRLQTDQVTDDKKLIEEWENQPLKIVAAYLIERMAEKTGPQNSNSSFRAAPAMQ